jgi:hypothetical protein
MLESCAVIELVNVLNAIKGGSLDKYAAESRNVLEVIDIGTIRFVDESEIRFDESSITADGPPDFEQLMQVSECFRARHANDDRIKEMDQQTRQSLEISLNGLEQATPLLEAKVKAAESVQSDK